MGRPTLIVVTGPAGSGKTTLAHALATRVGCPVLSRDELKEGMVHAHPGFVPAPSDPLTERTYGLFFQLLQTLLAAQVSIVAEAAFQHRLWVQGLPPPAELDALAELRVLRCTVAEDLARRRQQQRWRDQPTRAAHADVEHLDRRPGFVPLHLDAPTLAVDTSEGWSPGLDAVAAFCG